MYGGSTHLTFLYVAKAGLCTRVWRHTRPNQPLKCALCTGSAAKNSTVPVPTPNITVAFLTKRQEIRKHRPLQHVTESRNFVHHAALPAAWASCIGLLSVQNYTVVYKDMHVTYVTPLQLKVCQLDLCGKSGQVQLHLTAVRLVLRHASHFWHKTLPAYTDLTIYITCQVIE